MLVLTRKFGQGIIIEPDESLDPDTPIGHFFANGPITIWFQNVRQGQVKVSIDAHRDLSIVRCELRAARRDK